ncbi:MAG: hypothetical protein HYU97_09570 [Deltaproteobacteria bacterium]|nr:hypothetical protein [Deltaproteobacteria bacterium]
MSCYKVEGRSQPVCDSVKEASDLGEAMAFDAALVGVASDVADVGYQFGKGFYKGLENAAAGSFHIAWKIFSPRSSFLEHIDGINEFVYGSANAVSGGVLYWVVNEGLGIDVPYFTPLPGVNTVEDAGAAAANIAMVAGPVAYVAVKVPLKANLAVQMESPKVARARVPTEAEFLKRWGDPGEIVRKALAAAEEELLKAKPASVQVDDGLPSTRVQTKTPNVKVVEATSYDVLSTLIQKERDSNSVCADVLNYVRDHHDEVTMTHVEALVALLRKSRATQVLVELARLRPDLATSIIDHLIGQGTLNAIRVLGYIFNTHPEYVTIEHIYRIFVELPNPKEYYDLTNDWLSIKLQIGANESTALQQLVALQYPDQLRELGDRLVDAFECNVHLENALTPLIKGDRILLSGLSPWLKRQALRRNLWVEPLAKGLVERALARGHYADVMFDDLKSRYLVAEDILAWIRQTDFYADESHGRRLYELAKDNPALLGPEIIQELLANPHLVRVLTEIAFQKPDLLTAADYLKLVRSLIDQNQLPLLAKLPKDLALRFDPHLIDTLDETE